MVFQVIQTSTYPHPHPHPQQSRMAVSSSNNIKTYRHEFGKEFMANLSCFSKVHQYDDRHTYKNEWTKWVQRSDVAPAIDIEKRRLSENGYMGDIEDKMFKAGRYYFRKKTATPSSSILLPSSSTPGTPTQASREPLETPSSLVDGTATPTATAHRQRRPYITMSKNCIQLMDAHIKNMHATTTATTAAATTAAAIVMVFKPSSCYDDFNQTKMSSDEMTKEIGNIIEKYEKNAAGATTNITPDELTNDIIDKIKKTYKNRYYKFTSAQNNNNNNNDDNDDDNDDNK